MSALNDHILIHDSVASKIAEERFGLDEWNVSTNLDAHDSPDIVATHTDCVVATGEVETHHTISEDRARVWKEFGDSCVRFYLYVPKGAEEKVVRLISEYKVCCAGLRSYSLDDDLSVNPVAYDDPTHRHDDHPWWGSLGSLD